MSELNSKKKWTEIVEQAEHYLAIGQDEHYLWSYQQPIEEFPWELVYAVKGGAGYRSGIPVGVEFVAYHGGSGLTFRWTENFELREANGTSSHKFDWEAIGGVAARMQSLSAKKSLAEHFHSLAKTLSEQGSDLLKVAHQQFGNAELLRQYASEIWPSATTEDASAA